MLTCRGPAAMARMNMGNSSGMLNVCSIPHDLQIAIA